MKLANEHPDTAAQFRRQFEAAGYTLPLIQSAHDPELILDAKGRVVAEIDPDDAKPDAQMVRARQLMVLAVNVAAGLTKGGKVR